MKTRPNRTALVSVSDKTAEMVMLLADMKEAQSKAVELLRKGSEEITPEQDNEAQAVFNAYFDFWQAKLFQMIKNTLKETETQL